MAKKRTPQTAEAYAKYLYMAGKEPDSCGTYRASAIIDCRVRAFVDGVNWQKRKAKQLGKAGES